MNKTPTKTHKGQLASVVLLMVCHLSGFGCRSTEPGIEPNLASVLISGNTPGQIRDAAVEVFGENGYAATQTTPGNMVFEKKGSGMNNFAYGNWLGDTPIWVRVKAKVVPSGEMTCRLLCNVFLVRDRGSATEEELPVSKVHKGKYKKLLKEVAERFAKKWPTSG